MSLRLLRRVDTVTILCNFIEFETGSGVLVLSLWLHNLCKIWLFLSLSLDSHSRGLISTGMSYGSPC